MRLIGRVDAVDHRLDVPGDHAEGRPEFMAHVVEQRSPLVLVTLEPFDHGVEAADQLADRAPAAGWRLDAGRVVAALDAARGADQSVERPGGTRHPAADRDEHRHDHGDREDHG